MRTEPVVLDTAEAAGERSAEAVLAAVDAARAAGRTPVLGWPVGRTPAPVITALAHRGRPLDDVEVVLMDEFLAADGRAVPEDDPVSCRGAAERELLAPLRDALGDRALSAEHLHSPDPAEPTATERLIADLGGIDLFLVALGGSDGHVALNPPGSAADSRTRVVELAETTRRDNVGSFAVSGLDAVPVRGVTVGLGTIAASRTLLVLAHGAGKREVVRRLLEGDGFDPDLPASIVRTRDDVLVVLDAAAAGS